MAPTFYGFTRMQEKGGCPPYNSKFTLLKATILFTTIGKPTCSITVNAIPPSFEVGLVGLGVVGNTTVSSD